jgi:hypothetical protein
VEASRRRDVSQEPFAPPTLTEASAHTFTLQVERDMQHAGQGLEPYEDAADRAVDAGVGVTALCGGDFHRPAEGPAPDDPQAPILTLADAEEFTTDLVFAETSAADDTVRDVICKRVSRTAIRCSFIAGGDVGRAWEGRGIVRSLPAATGYEFAVHAFRLVQQPDGTIKIEDGRDVYWQGFR